MAKEKSARPNPHFQKMKRKLRLVILLASLAGGGIISFQLFWIFSAYKVNKDSFNKAASLALQRSIDSYQLASIGYKKDCNCKLNTAAASPTAKTKVSEAKPEKTAQTDTSSRAAANKDMSAVRTKLLEKLRQKLAEGKVPANSSIKTSDTTNKTALTPEIKKEIEKITQQIAQGKIPANGTITFRDTTYLAIHNAPASKPTKETKKQPINEKTPSNSKVILRDTIRMEGIIGSRMNKNDLLNNHLNQLSLSSDSSISQMMLRLAAWAKNKPILLDSLAKIYQKELSKSNIDLSFELSFLQTLPETNAPLIIGQTGFFGNSNIVQATFSNSFKWLLWRTLSPIVISFILICLTIGGFWYLLHIIMQQRDLDNMKNDFINNMTHELQTPISILRSTHEALSQFGEVKDPEKTSRYLKMNMAVIDKLSKDVLRILDISEYEKQEIVPDLVAVNLKDLINEVIARFELSAQDRISFSYKAENEEVTTEAYAVDTIVSNLVDNALKYAKETDGQVWIAVDSFPAYWQLQVRDRGIGIEPKFLPFIFDKFYRVPTGDLHNVKGYGLGLNYVKKLTEMLKGEISVSSEPGNGTTFTLKFKHHEKN